VINIPPALVVKLTCRSRATFTVFGTPQFSDDRREEIGRIPDKKEKRSTDSDEVSPSGKYLVLGPSREGSFCKTVEETQDGFVPEIPSMIAGHLVKFIRRFVFLQVFGKFAIGPQK
jgi:hypothetical protein